MKILRKAIINCQKRNHSRSRLNLLFPAMRLAAVEHTLGYYSTEQEASLQIVGRMQSIEHPVVGQTVDDIMYIVFQMYRVENVCGCASNINGKLLIDDKLKIMLFRSIPKYLEKYSLIKDS